MQKWAWRIVIGFDTNKKYRDGKATVEMGGGGGNISVEGGQYLQFPLADYVRGDKICGDKICGGTASAPTAAYFSAYALLVQLLSLLEPICIVAHLYQIYVH